MKEVFSRDKTDNLRAKKVIITFIILNAFITKDVDYERWLAQTPTVSPLSVHRLWNKYCGQKLPDGPNVGSRVQ